MLIFGVLTLKSWDHLMMLGSKGILTLISSYTGIKKKASAMITRREVMISYIHRVQYYETDQMGITHHSNYIRWMEEARVEYLEQVGWGYAKLEELGVISPVLAVECLYKETTTFFDEIEIRVRVGEFKGVRLVMEYEMVKKSNGHIVFAGLSKHCFLNKEHKPVRLKKELPEFYQKLTDLVENQP